MAKDSPEQDFLDKFHLKCANINDWTVYASNCNAKSKMDFEAKVLIGENPFYLKCECKVASKIDSSNCIDRSYGDKHNTVHKIFGELLKGRNLSNAVSSTLETYYGFIIPERDFLFFKNKYTSMIDDWILFGITFNIKYVLVFNEFDDTLNVFSWHDVWENGISISTY